MWYNDFAEGGRGNDEWGKYLDSLEFDVLILKLIHPSASSYLIYCVQGRTDAIGHLAVSQVLYQPWNSRPIEVFNFKNLFIAVKASQV